MRSSRRASVVLLVAGCVLLGGLASAGGTTTGDASAAPTAPMATETPAARTTARRPELPQGGRRIFPGHLLVAFYGTASTPTMGVLGEDTPDRITERLREAAAPFARDRWKVQIVHELIVTVADPTPGSDGDYSHDIPREHVERYVRAARRNRALLVLDLQPGRSTFLEVARRWEWALEKPWVGLALDPEWRMAPGQVPGQTIGQVRAAEVNRVSRWLQRIARRHDHPQKLLVLHQFRRDMVIGLDDVVSRRRLATVQHVDGFGTRSQKRQTYATVAQPEQFEMGFKLFYDEDVDLMRPRDVLALRPRVRFVSYQ